MSTTDLVHLYFDRSNALQGYWTLYVVIIGGLLAFSSMRQRPSFWTTVMSSSRRICLNRVLIFLLPFARPPGLPDRPGWKRV